MSRKAVREGDVIAMRLLGHGFAPAIVSKYPGRGSVMLLRIFGPRFQTLEQMSEVDQYDPEGSLMIAVTSTDPVVKKEWPVIGHLDLFDRERWVQHYFRRDDLVGRVYLVEYAKNDPNNVIAERLAKENDVTGLPVDTMYGSEVLAEHVDDILLQNERIDPEVWGNPRR